jgi:hypothetical protein
VILTEYRDITLGDLRRSDRGRRIRVRRHPSETLARPETYGRIEDVRCAPYWVGIMVRFGVTLTVSFPARRGGRNYETHGPFPMSWPASLEVIYEATPDGWNATPDPEPPPRIRRRTNHIHG